MISARDKQRFVTLVYGLVHATGSPPAWKTSGVPKDKVRSKYLSDAIAVVAAHNGTRPGYFSNKAALYPELQRYCIEDGFLEGGATLRATSKGNDLLRWGWPLYFIFTHWSFRHAVSVIIGAVLGYFLRPIVG